MLWVDLDLYNMYFSSSVIGSDQMKDGCTGELRRKMEEEKILRDFCKPKVKLKWKTKSHIGGCYVDIMEVCC
jgi:hypothetical protein